MPALPASPLHWGGQCRILSHTTTPPLPLLASLPAYLVLRESIDDNNKGCFDWNKTWWIFLGEQSPFYYNDLYRFSQYILYDKSIHWRHAFKHI